MKRSRKHRHDVVTVSGFFESRDAVEHALDTLVRGGTPRDLVEVVVAPSADERYYDGRVRRLGTLALPYAAKGALIGLFASILLSLYILIFPGFEVPRQIAIVQLLGPNLGAVGGGLIGAGIGALRPRRAAGVYSRALERDAILLVIFERHREHSEVIARALGELGAEDIRVDEPRERLVPRPEPALQP